MPIFAFGEKHPKIHPTAYVSPRSVIIGDVEIGERSSVWENAVIRGDLNSIRIGSHTSIQDNCTIHVDTDHPTRIGDYVTVGHNAVVHGSRIGDYVLVGIGSVILSDAEIEGPSIIAAGAVVKTSARVPSHSLFVGVPASMARRLRREDVETLKKRCDEYTRLARQHQETGKATGSEETI